MGQEVVQFNNSRPRRASLSRTLSCPRLPSRFFEILGDTAHSVRYVPSVKVLGLFQVVVTIRL